HRPPLHSFPTRRSSDLRDRGVAPAHSMKGYATYRHAGAGRIGIAVAATTCWCGPKAVMAGNSLLVKRRCRARGPGVTVVVHSLVAQRVNRDGMTTCTHPRPYSIAIHLADCRRGIRVSAVGMGVFRREGRPGGHRRIQVRRLAWHEGPFIAE